MTTKLAQRGLAPVDFDPQVRELQHTPVCTPLRRRAAQARWQRTVPGRILTRALCMRAHGWRVFGGGAGVACGWVSGMVVVAVAAGIGCALVVFTQAYKDHYSDPESHLRIEANEILMYAAECHRKGKPFKIFVMDPDSGQGAATVYVTCTHTHTRPHLLTRPTWHLALQRQYCRVEQQRPSPFDSTSRVQCSTDVSFRSGLLRHVHKKNCGDTRDTRPNICRRRLRPTQCSLKRTAYRIHSQLPTRVRSVTVRLSVLLEPQLHPMLPSC